MTIAFNCESAIAAMRRRADVIHSAAHSAVQAAATGAAATARATTAWKDKTGATRASIGTRSRAVFRVSTVARGAARFLESGTGLYGPKGAKYPIPGTGGKGKVLRFVVAGTVMFRRHVMHPGIKATHFMHNAAQFEAPRFFAGCQSALHQTLQRR